LLDRIFSSKLRRGQKGTLHDSILFMKLLMIFLFSYHLAAGQNINDLVMEASFKPFVSEKAGPRKFMLSGKKSAKYNPLMYAGASLMFLYQNVISEQIQAGCVYKISCSEYTKLSIREHGFFKGGLAGFNQLSECFHGSVKEHPPAFIDKGKILNSVGNNFD
jgi:putative component of membrane protein insertase Oxa1/YidC/SpoIIIJ protein YidD